MKQSQELYHILHTDEQRSAMPKDAPNTAWFYGTTVGGSSKNSWDVEDQILSKVKCNRLVTLRKGKEEPFLDPKHIEALEEEVEKEGRTMEAKSKNAFAKLGTETLKVATVFECHFKDNVPPIKWEILGDAVYIMDDKAYETIEKKF